jgi:DNA-binding NarL/FixJ family response regulator
MSRLRHAEYQGREEMDRVRVLIVDDQRRVREGLKALLAASTAGTPMCPAEIEVVGQAANGLDAVRLAGELQPDAVVMDVRMPGMDGLEATRLIKARWPHIRVILLTLYPDERRQALATPADAFLVKGCPSEELLRRLVVPASESMQVERHGCDETHRHLDGRGRLAIMSELQLSEVRDDSIK